MLRQTWGMTADTGADIGDVGLFGEGGARWQPVSPRLATARCIVLWGCLLFVATVAVVLAVTVDRWWWWAAAAGALALGVWATWLVRRQVAAITWAELPEDLVIRTGRLFRRLVSIPYGRLQYVDLQSGPLQRRLGLASLEMHTASPESSGVIPGLPVRVAEDLRERLTVRGESQRAGL